MSVGFLNPFRKVRGCRRCWPPDRATFRSNLVTLTTVVWGNSFIAVKHIVEWVMFLEGELLCQIHSSTATLFPPINF